MWNSKKSVNLSIVVCALLALILLALTIVGPMLFNLYLTGYRGLVTGSETLQRLTTTFLVCFYPSAVFAGIILYALLRLLFNLRAGDIFITHNVNLLKAVSWCCISIGVITLVGGFFYMPFFFVAAAGGFTGMLLRVLKNVMQNAVIIRTENELTI